MFFRLMRIVCCVFTVGLYCPFVLYILQYCVMFGLFEFDEILTSSITFTVRLKRFY